MAQLSYQGLGFRDCCLGFMRIVNNRVSLS